MARRFALALVAILALLLGAFVVMRSVRKPKAGAPPPPAPRPTAVVPPTPIPARNVTLFFESKEGDGVLHPEARDVPVAADDVAFLRSVAAGVVEGPRSADLVKPFPEGWTLRGAYLLRDGVAVLDVAPPALGKWQAGAHEEDAAMQALAVSVGRNMTSVTRVVFLVAGEPAETLAGHVDLAHPIAPDFTRAAAETPRPAQPPPAATPTPAPTPTATSTPAPRPPKPAKQPARPKGETT
ncbi:MAG: GerMN domain-containing protein [Acidobacteriota bacterium]